LEVNLRELSFLGDKISALQSGKASAHTILFVHGFLDNAASFTSLLPLLGQYNCVALDLPGHGKSAHRSADAHYHLSDYVYDLHALISSQNWGQVSLVGHSLGGLICSIYAACFPENVKQMVSIESLGPLTEPEFTSAEQLRESMISRVRANKPVKQPESMAQLISSRMRISDLSYEHCELILSRNTYQKDNKLYWRTDKRLRTKSSIRFTPNQASSVLENIDCPYLFIMGDAGFTKIKRLFKHRKNLIKHLCYKEIQGGHHVHLDSPEQVAQSISNHFK
jgi:pimeloyl-ACP methyl ester carboxylesterase